MEEEQNCHLTFDIRHAYEQITSELNAVKYELEHSTHVIQELKVQNAKLKSDKFEGLQKLETTIIERNVLKADVDRLKIIETIKLKRWSKKKQI